MSAPLLAGVSDCGLVPPGSDEGASPFLSLVVIFMSGLPLMVALQAAARNSGADQTPERPLSEGLVRSENGRLRDDGVIEERCGKIPAAEMARCCATGIWNHSPEPSNARERRGLSNSTCGRLS